MTHLYRRCSTLINTLTTYIPVASTSVTSKVTIEVRRAAGMTVRRDELNGFPGQMTRLQNGELRTFLEDGDTIVLRAHAARDGATRIGFGEARGMIAASGAYSVAS